MCCLATNMSTAVCNSPMDRRLKGRVLFAASTEVITAPSPIASLLEQDATNSWKEDLWYQAKDLALFRTEARELCRQLRSNITASTVAMGSIDSHTRGLEQRMCLERQRRKFLANRCIVKASIKMREEPNDWNEERPACLSRKITAWAAQLAVEEAQRDFDRAYLVERKRSCCVSDEIGRCVRQRTSVIQS